MSNTNQQHSGRSHRLALFIVIFSIAAALLLVINRQYVVDQLTVWQYQPNADIVALADRSTMNEKGKFLFYASHPTLEAATDFNDKCDRKEQSTAILGCYTGRNIYIYNVTDEKLDGIREVTAAHEMLHAAYDRLSDDEKSKINKLLDAEHEKLKNDKRLAERMAFYARTEPGERENELHSVIGTEVASISPELEKYYGQYFDNRGNLVALHNKYESVFTSLQERGEALADQLTELGDTIEADSVEYNKDVNELNEDIATFNAKAEAGGFVSQDDFETARDALVARAGQLDAKRIEINNKVAQYEALRQELVSIASQSEALSRSIDSSLAPAPSL